MKPVLIASVFLLATLPGFSEPAKPAAADQAPANLMGILKTGAPVKVEVVTVKHDDSIYPFAEKIDNAAALSPEKLKELKEKTPPGEPLAYGEGIGLTREEYDKYIEAWKKRQVVPVGESAVLLDKGADGSWKIRGAQALEVFNTMKYDPARDVWVTPNGELARAKDVAATPMSVWGEWKGHEWKLEKSDELSSINENIALGKTPDGKSAYLIYRFVESSTTTKRPIADRGIVLRIPLFDGGSSTDPLLEEARKRAEQKAKAQRNR